MARSCTVDLLTRLLSKFAKCLPKHRQDSEILLATEFFLQPYEQIQIEDSNAHSVCDSQFGRMREQVTKQQSFSDGTEQVEGTVTREQVQVSAGSEVTSVWLQTPAGLKAKNRIGRRYGIQETIYVWGLRRINHINVVCLYRRPLKDSRQPADKNEVNAVSRKKLESREETILGHSIGESTGPRAPGFQEIPSGLAE
jgi:hypothetical protein